MDPANPRREVVRHTDSGPMHLEPVQKWVLSVLAFVTIIHLSGGLVVAALASDADRVIAVAVFRAIHQKALLSPWLLLGLLPGLVGLVLVLR